MAVKRPTPVDRNAAWWLVAGVVLLGLAGAEVYYLWPRSASTHATSTSAPLPPLTESPFLNTKPGVAYVGDERCAGCHRDYNRSYHQHPMGRSLFAAADSPALEQYDRTSNTSFAAGQFRFQAVRRGSKLIHKEWCEDAKGNIVAQKEAEIAYVVGSGAQARSYLFQHDGFLFQSPLTWYVQKSQWQLSPGYEQYQRHMSRRVDTRCLYCHCQEAHPVENTINRYREPAFGQLAIGCERCHGPGELHVASRQKTPPSGDIDPTIVNPRHLPPASREAVCEQCHLQGESIVVRRGREQNEYRPGLPLHEYQSIFVRSPDVADSSKIVSHVEQMHLSACFQKSGGKFGCASCHDPHGLPAPDEKLAFYRKRCLNCHAAQSAPECAFPLEQRKAKDPRDNCVACHMPRNPSSNVTHFAITDHRVVRHADRPLKAPASGGRGDVPIVAFHRHLVPPGDEESQRDLGIALANLAALSHEFGAEQIREFLSRRALPSLDRAVERAPDDVPAIGARSFALFALGRADEALAALEIALAKTPNHEETLTRAADIAESRGRLDLALEYGQRLVKINPYAADNHRRLALVHAKSLAWPQALQAAQAAVRTDPFRAETRALLITTLLETGNRARAETEFDILGVIQPSYQAKIRPWFTERLKQSK